MDNVYWPKIWVGPMGIFIVYVQVFKFAHVLKKKKKKDELAYLIYRNILYVFWFLI